MSRGPSCSRVAASRPGCHISPHTIGVKDVPDPSKFLPGAARWMRKPAQPAWKLIRHRDLISVIHLSHLCSDFTQYRPVSGTLHSKISMGQRKTNTFYGCLATRIPGCPTTSSVAYAVCWQACACNRRCSRRPPGLQAQCPIDRSLAIIGSIPLLAFKARVLKEPLYRRHIVVSPVGQHAT